jgi:class 3 adenylate cyclase
MIFVSEDLVVMIAPTAATILEQLSVPDAPVLNLLALCQTPEYLHVWREGPELVRRFASLLLEHGHPTLALEVAARGLDENYYPNDQHLLYCRARALVNSGNPTRADLFVRALVNRADLPLEIRSDALCLAGRIRKDLAARSADQALRLGRLRDAFRFYEQAFALSRDTFPGINAATLALLVGDRARSREIASEVRDRVLAELDQPGRDRDYWRLATLGEAYLLLGDQSAAKDRYAQAVRLARAGHNDGDIASMLRQLRLLREQLSIGDDVLGQFHLGPVIAFAGHAIDRPGDPICFPSDPALEAAVRRAIKRELDALEANIGYFSPGCGSGILFGELMHERDAELHAVLPFDADDYRYERLTYGLPEFESWQRRHEELQGSLRVTTHFATTEKFLDDQVLYDFAGSFLQGLALSRAAQLGVEAVALVVQDPATQAAGGNLATYAANWRQTGRALRVINLAELRGALPPATTTIAAPLQRPRASTPKRALRAMLFADVAGFCGLPEPHLPEFFIAFLEIVAKQLRAARALFQNTWGDGLYVVFSDVVACADFALRLLERLERLDFRSFGFKLCEGKEPGVRIGLHVGPVFKGHDAIIGRDNYFGSHVSRAARIEPVTAPGCAFVSEQFAAALAVAPGHDFVCEYLGPQPLAKSYDVCPLYRLTSRTDRAGVEFGSM